MNEIMKTIIQCVLLIPTVATIGAFWFLVFSTIIAHIIITNGAK